MTTDEFTPVETDKIRIAAQMGWEPCNPNDLKEYRRTFDWEKPGDREFIDSLTREAELWLEDNA